MKELTPTSPAAIKYLLENKEDWVWLGYNTHETYEVYKPESYPCIAIGIFDDYSGGYIYDFAYMKDFE